MTNAAWQERISLMKLLVEPAKADTKMRISRVRAKVNNFAAVDDNDPVEPQWIRYRTYINDILKNIRKGGTDYCYFIYQITDLLKYEHDRLMTEYMPEDEMFRVWLKDQ